MFGAAEILMMQQLMTSNNSSTYMHSSRHNNSAEAKQQLYKTENMFLQLNEMLSDGSVKPITVNFSYVKSFRDSKYRTGEFVDARWQDKDIVNVTQVTLINGNEINVHESSAYINSMLKY